MGYAVELYFDQETSERVTALARTIFAQSGGLDLLGWGFQPHISLAGDETNIHRLASFAALP